MARGYPDNISSPIFPAYGVVGYLGPVPVVLAQNIPVVFINIKGRGVIRYIGINSTSTPTAYDVAPTIIIDDVTINARSFVQKLLLTNISGEENALRVNRYDRDSYIYTMETIHDWQYANSVVVSCSTPDNDGPTVMVYMVYYPIQ